MDSMQEDGLLAYGSAISFYATSRNVQGGYLSTSVGKWFFKAFLLKYYSKQQRDTVLKLTLKAFQNGKTLKDKTIGIEIMDFES